MSCHNLDQINNRINNIEGLFNNVSNSYNNPFGALGSQILAQAQQVQNQMASRAQGLIDRVEIPALGIILNIVKKRGFSFGDILSLIRKFLAGGIAFPDYFRSVFSQLSQLNPKDMFDIGSGLDALPSAGHCFRPIDDMLIEAIQDKLVGFIRKTPVGLGACSLQKTTHDYKDVINGQISEITKLTDVSIFDQISAIQNTQSPIEKIALVRKLSQKINNLSPEQKGRLNKSLFGKASNSISNISNYITGNIMRIDPCCAQYEGAAGKPIPAEIPETPPVIYPTIPAGGPTAANENQIELQGQYRASIWTIGDVLRKDEMMLYGNNAQHIGANTTLQMITRTLINGVEAGKSQQAYDDFDKNVSRIIAEKRNSGEWDPKNGEPANTQSALIYFTEKTEVIKALVKAEENTLYAYNAVQHTTNFIDAQAAVDSGNYISINDNTKRNIEDDGAIA